MVRRGGTRGDGAWEASFPFPVLRVGDLVLTQTDGSARLSRALSDARAADTNANAAESPHSLPVKQAGLLAFLMRHHDHIVSKSRLIEAVWGQAGTEPGVLDVHMTRLRHALAKIDASGSHIRIETRRGMGYTLHVEEP